jgi:hypothetical protein
VYHANGGLLGELSYVVGKLRGTAPLTVVGALSLDSDDLAAGSDAQNFAVMWHEIGHVMGIGSHWSSLVLTGGPPPRP